MTKSEMIPLCKLCSAFHRDILTHFLEKHKELVLVKIEEFWKTDQAFSMDNNEVLK